MASIDNIKLSFYCDKKINDLTACDTGYFCSSCDKVVIDFRNLTKQDLEYALSSNTEVCGLFNASQSYKSNNISISKRLATGGMLVVSLLGASMAEVNAQKNSPQLEEVKSLEDSIEKESLFLGTLVESTPEYKYNGEKGMMEFLTKNLNYPLNCPNGRVICKFLIDVNGKVTNPIIIRGLTKAADDEVLRVVKLMEFIPAKQNGKPVAMEYILPITFKREH